jgi:hypothetical protein
MMSPIKIRVSSNSTGKINNDVRKADNWTVDLALSKASDYELSLLSSLRTIDDKGKFKYRKIQESELKLCFAIIGEEVFHEMI